MKKWILAAATMLLCTPLTLRADPRKLQLLDFEDEAEAKPYILPPFVEVSTDHATSGKKSLHFKRSEGWMNFQITDPEILKKCADYRTMLMDVYNPTNELLHLFVVISDTPAAEGKESAFNHGYFFLPPGQSTLKFSLACSPRLWPHEGQIYVNQKDLKSIRFFTGDDTRKFDPPIEFYIDNVRLEDSGVELPKVDGLKAFQFGASRDTGTAPGFVTVTEKTAPYSDKTGFGWQKGPNRFFHAGMNPDDLGNSALGGSFVVDLKPGDYVVQTCIDPINEWGWSFEYTSRTLTINGKEALKETMDGKTFVKERFCRFEDDEDLPGTDLWKDRVKKISPVRSFEATIGADGKLTVELNGDAAGGMCFLVVYPKDKAKEGDAWMTALDSIRKERFDGRINAGGLMPEGAAPTPTTDEKTRGFIAFPRSPERPLHALSAPAADERNAAFALHACPGERTGSQFGLYPLAAVKGLTITASDLKGPGGATIPASAFELTKVRHYYKRFGNGPCLILMPLIQQKFQTLDLVPGTTRPIWLTLNTPVKTPAGQYTGTLKIKAGAQSCDLPVNVTVNNFVLDPVDDLAISGMGTGAGFWISAYNDPATKELWYQAAEQMIALQARCGFTSLTGGPNMMLRGVKDGKVDIDYTDADRWMELAHKYGLTKLGDSYQGFDVNLGFGRDGSAGGPANNDANAQSAYKMKFGELLKVVYADVEKHAKEKNWPPRAYSLLDEPSGEAAVNAGKVHVETHVKNAVGSKFSGYYAPGNQYSKTEVFYPLLKLSIMSTITDPMLKASHDNGNQVWSYMNPGYTDFMNLRHLYGRWAYNSRQHGLDGITGGFFYVNTVPYYDMSDVEGSWGVVYPSKDGINSTLWMEQIALGINDYRYLKTLRARVEAAKKAGGKDEAVKQAEKFLADVCAATKLESDPMVMQSLSKPGDLAALRQQATKLIGDLTK